MSEIPRTVSSNGDSLGHDFGHGLIIVASADTTRYAMFSQSLLRLKRPATSDLFWVCSYSVARNFNEGIRHAMRKGMQWVWLLGDDHAFDPTMLYQLLSNDLDIVSPICLRRRYPFFPLLFSSERADGTFVQYGWDIPQTTGLLEVAASGNAGMLIKRRVLDAIGDPWLKIGRISPDSTSEDLTFCKEARAKGFTIHVDLDCRLDHITPVSVRPAVSSDGLWEMEVDLGSYTNIRVPGCVKLDQRSDAHAKLLTTS